MPGGPAVEQKQLSSKKQCPQKHKVQLLFSTILLVVMHVILEYYIILVVTAHSLFLLKHFKRCFSFVSSVFLFLRKTNLNLSPIHLPALWDIVSELSLGRSSELM